MRLQSTTFSFDFARAQSAAAQRRVVQPVCTGSGRAMIARIRR
jgi:hypothetical protein